MSNGGANRGAKPGSTRLAIVEKSLADTVERLRELPPSPRVRELRAKAEGFERALQSWTLRPPTEEQRVMLLRLVLDLNVEVMAAGREASEKRKP
jgi:hypothetical protein